MRPNRKWIKPIWPPLNVKCTFLHSQTRYQRNFKGYTYVFGDRFSVGTHENTIRPKLTLTNPRWPVTLKCMYLHSKLRYQRNYIDYTYVFGDWLFNGTHGNTMRPNRQWKIPIWGPLNYKCLYLHWPDIIDIPTAIPTLAWTGFLLGPRRIQCDQTGRGQIRVANSNRKHPHFGVG